MPIIIDSLSNLLKDEDTKKTFEQVSATGSIKYIPISNDIEARQIFLVYALIQFFSVSIQPTALLLKQDDIFISDLDEWSDDGEVDADADADAVILAVLEHSDSTTSRSVLNVVENNLLKHFLDPDVSDAMAINEVLGIYERNRALHAVLNKLIFKILVTSRSCFVAFADLCLPRELQLKTIRFLDRRQNLLLTRIMDNLLFKSFFLSDAIYSEAQQHIELIKNFKLNYTTSLFLSSESLECSQREQLLMITPQSEMEYELDVDEIIEENRFNHVVVASSATDVLNHEEESILDESPVSVAVIASPKPRIQKTPSPIAAFFSMFYFKSLRGSPTPVLPTNNDYVPINYDDDVNNAQVMPR